MSDSHGARSIFTGDGDSTTIYNHAGLIARDIGHRYTNVKRPRVDSGSFNSSEVFSPAGMVPGAVFHSPITSTIAASVPTQSESTFSRKSTPSSFRFFSLILGSYYQACVIFSEYYTDCKMLTSLPLFKYLSVESLITACFVACSTSSHTYKLTFPVLGDVRFAILGDNI